MANQQVDLTANSRRKLLFRVRVKKKMPNHDFHTLSPIDFENLVRDLIKNKFEVLSESFTQVKDRGIDFRGFISDQKSIVQYKHYQQQGLISFLI